MLILVLLFQGRPESVTSPRSKFYLGTLRRLRPCVEPRVFVPPELTPERLLSFYQENTAIQAKELTKDRIGQWMPFTGVVSNV